MYKITYFKVFEQSFRELSTGDTINIKKEKGDGVHFVVTINKGRKEYLMPIAKAEVLQFLQNKDLSKKSIFVNGEGYNRVKWEANKPVKLEDNEVLAQFTELGQSLYLMNSYGKEVIDAFNKMF